MFRNSQDIIDHFLDRELDEQAKSYLDVHAKRYAYALSELKAIRSRINANPITILDIGPSFFTELYRIEFPEDKLYTLGLNAPQNRFGHLPQGVNYDEHTHFYFDLNDSQNKDRWLKGLPEFDIIVMAEVIEHVYTAPELVLAFVKHLLKKRGYLIIQTPNAVELTKRTKLMFKGINPYQTIRENSGNPGHFREYTKKEMIYFADRTGFKTVKTILTNYFLYDSSKTALYKRIRSFSIPNFRRYLFMLLQNSQ